MELTENKGNKKMKKTTKAPAMNLERIGERLNIELNKHFDEWKAGMEYRFVLSAQGYRAKALGMDTSEFASRLVKLGYIKIVRTPKGQRFVFAGDCPFTTEEMHTWLMDQVYQKEEEKRFAKQQAKAQQA